MLNLINGVDTMGMVQDRATIEQKIKQLKEYSGRDDLSVRTEVEDLLHENRISAFGILSSSGILEKSGKF